MTIMSDREIKEAVAGKQLGIVGYKEQHVQPASYDCKVGRVLVAGRGIVDPHKDLVRLRMGDWAEIETAEVFRLPADICATYGLRSAFTRRGLSWYGGPQIDPGYHGRVFVTIYNPTTDPIDVTSEDTMFTVVFHKLAKAVEHPYDGRFQHGVSFPEEDVERLCKMSAPTLYDVIRNVSTLEDAVAQLTVSMTKIVQDMSWIKGIAIGVLISVVVIAVTLVLKEAGVL